MKIKFNHTFFVYFININMAFNLIKECIRLTEIIDDNTFELNLDQQYMYSMIGDNCPKINFIWGVLTLTMKYPQVELYLKDLLNYFTVNELEKINNKGPILHSMTYDPCKISLNAFEIIINHGININTKNYQGRTAAHILFLNKHNKHVNSILNLLIEHGVDLNILNNCDNSVLDSLTYHHRELNEETQNYITTLIDFGAITNNPKQNTEIYDFIEYYKSSTIKPAIKK